MIASLFVKMEFHFLKGNMKWVVAWRKDGGSLAKV
jgi:hypothetical protein